VVHEDFLHPDLHFESGLSIQLDIFLPDLLLAFEYQGEQHFMDIHKFGSANYYSKRDEQKRIACNQHGITLVEVPYWWNFQLESLKSTIHKVRPDLVDKPDDFAPISTEPPPSLTRPG
jgi:hypothetical protein